MMYINIIMEIWNQRRFWLWNQIKNTFKTIMWLLYLVIIKLKAKDKTKIYGYLKKEIFIVHMLCKYIHPKHLK